jgi:hypothetical protein
MSKKTLFSFFKSIDKDQSNSDAPSASTNIGATTLLSDEQRSLKIQRTESREVDGISRDPANRLQICKEPVNKRDEIRRLYIKTGPYQPCLHEYPPTQDGKQCRRFQKAWFKKYPWLEYSPQLDRAFCLPCFLFETDPPSRPAFTVEGFKSWKRVSGPKCAFLQHAGGPNSSHFCAVKSSEDLMNPSQHINRVLNAQCKNEVEKNRLRLKTTIGTVRWLAFQACAFRGHDESVHSRNRGNFIELIKHSAQLNEKVAEVVLENAPGNAKYTSPMIQKEVLHILGDVVRRKIRKEVGDGYFCILVDEAQDMSNREQMAIVLRFIDGDGLLRERFFGVVGVKDTTAMTLKNTISDVLALYDLQVDNMRGQGYDGASNMRGAWNGLQALFLRECPYAYYVHCFAHQLQLALVAATKDVQDIWLFFSKLNSIVNLVNASPKRHSELQSAQLTEFASKIASGELETGRGANQIKNLQRAGATRWSSHFGSVVSLIDLFHPSCVIIENISKNGLNASIRGEAKGAYIAMLSFEFVFILHLVAEIMGITDMLCQAMQRKSQDIVNAMTLVRTTKALLQKLRESGWNTFFQRVESFCIKHKITMPDMGASYLVGTRRSCQQYDNITINHHYQVDIFNAAIDFQLVELNHRFSEGAMELLILSTALDPRDGYKSFNIDNICKLAEKFYPEDFTTHEIRTLRSQLQHYEIDIPCHQSFQNLSTISEICKMLVETRKNEFYYLIYRIFCLVLTLPVSTASTERAFSAMKLVKTILRNKMDDEFLADCMILTIERELAEDIDLDSIVNDFDSLKERRVALQ